MNIFEQLKNYENLKLWSKGIELLEVQVEPLSSELLELYGWFCSRNGDYDKAIDSFEILCNYDSNNAKYHYMLGYQYYVQSRFDEAIPHFISALNCDEDYFVVKYRLAYSYLKANNNKNSSYYNNCFIDAIKLLESAHVQYENMSVEEQAKHRKTYSDICFIHGKAIVYMDKYLERSIELFLTAVTLDDSNVFKHYQLAKAYYCKHDYNHAKTALVADRNKYIVELNLKINEALSVENLDKDSEEESDRRTGKILNYNSDRGFGFIGSENNNYFFHISTYESQGQPVQGDIITFDTFATEKGLKAINVRKIS